MKGWLDGWQNRTKWASRHAVLTSLLYSVQVKVCQLYNKLNGCFDRIYIAWKDFIEGNESAPQWFQNQIEPGWRQFKNSLKLLKEKFSCYPAQEYKLSDIRLFFTL